jgi:23S rRNA (uracil1939-C5)-methyltransferase
MAKKKQVILENVRLGKLVHGGQCLAEAPSGKKLFVWGGLPGELVSLRVTKKKSSYMEGIVTEVHEASADRLEPIEPLSYLSTSPWQIMTFEVENKAKQAILSESFEREGLKDLQWADFSASEQQLGYRNKNEFGFWGSDDGLHLAHYVRGTSGKQMVVGSALAAEAINVAARAVRDELNRLDIWGGKLKTVLIRASKGGEAVAALFVKEELDMGDFKLPEGLKGIDIYYSNPLSPASIPTKKLYSLGDIKLSDSISGKNIIYDVMSFFQVNIPAFEQALTVISKQIGGKPSIDFYSGVGAIGIAVGSDTLVESDDANIVMARQNVKGTDTKVIHASSETALEYVTADKILIVDPPRAGLHKDVIEKINDIKPPKVIYLSCNPSTQARDIKLLQENYNVIHARGFNFFPRTPHIESLLILELKN